MQRFFLIILLAILGVGIANGQEFTGSAAETIKKEIVKSELEKVSMLMKGGSDAADWFERFDDDAMVWFSNSAGMSTKGPRTKAELVAEWRAGVRKMSNVKHYDFHIHLYGIPSPHTAVLTYRASGTVQDKGKAPVSYHELAMEVLVKEDGMWRNVSHSVLDAPE